MKKKQKNRKLLLQNQRNRMINRRYTSTVKTLTKLFLGYFQKFQNEIDDENKKKIQTLFQQIVQNIYSMVDKGVKKKVFHKNTAARKKSRIGKLLVITQS